jgi:hypothetical protein
MRAIFLAAALLLPGTALAQANQNDVVTWELPTQRVDGTLLPATEYAQTIIQQSSSATGTFATVATITGTGLTWTNQNTAGVVGTRCYRAIAVDTDGLVSDPSAAVCKTVKAKPRPPGNVRVK